MKCPVCADVRMKEVEKDGILIDVCPDCKGIWLDRGELDKLTAGVRELKRELFDSGNESPLHGGNPESRYDNSFSERDKSYRHQEPDKSGYPKRDGSGHGYDKKHKKKKSVLDVFGDLFD